MADNSVKQSRFYSDMTELLNQHKEHGTSNNSYDTLFAVLSDPSSEAGLVVEILEDLEHCVSLLNKEHQPLVAALMKMKWIDRGPALTCAYQSLMLNLVSAHTFYMKPCLHMLVSKFTADETVVEVSLDGANKNPADENLSHVHSLLKSLSNMVPMISVVVVQTLENFCPYINKSVAHFEKYTQNVLLVSTYMPANRLDILNLVVKTMLKLDVRSSRFDISEVVYPDDEESVNEDEEGAIFDMETDSESQANVSKPETTEDKLAVALPQAGSLDAMMTLTFQYIKDQCYVDGNLDWDATKKLYRELLSVFDKYIFPTHGLCHVQYLLFYICSFKEALADGFIDYLWKKVTDPTAQCVYRQSAACYIGSFLTRTKYLSVNTSKEVVELMVKWIHSYLDQICDQTVWADLTYHAPFYSMCQSVFYVFCFKHNDFMQMKRGHKWAESLNFQRIVTSKLNPLRLCLPIIVSTFASAARLHQLAFCDTIIERNNRYSLPVTASTSVAVNSREKQLATYFPFDPYLLPRSMCYIRALYRDFRGSLSGREDDSDEDDDDFLPSEDDEDIAPPTIDISMTLGKSPADVLQYGISPGFKHG